MGGGGKTPSWHRNKIRRSLSISLSSSMITLHCASLKCYWVKQVERISVGPNRKWGSTLNLRGKTDGNRWPFVMSPPPPPPPPPPRPGGKEVALLHPTIHFFFIIIIVIIFIIIISIPSKTNWYQVLFLLFYRMLLGLTRFYRILLGSIGPFRVLLFCSAFFSGFYWVLPGMTVFTGFYWVLLDLDLDFTEFY